MSDSPHDPPMPEDPQLGEFLDSEVPPPADDYWARIDASLHDIEARDDFSDTDLPVVRQTSMTNETPTPSSSLRPTGTPTETDGLRRRSRVLLAAAAALLVLGGVAGWAVLGGGNSNELDTDPNNTSGFAGTPESDGNPASPTGPSLGSDLAGSGDELIDEIDAACRAIPTTDEPGINRGLLADDQTELVMAVGGETGGFAKYDTGSGCQVVRFDGSLQASAISAGSSGRVDRARLFTAPAFRDEPAVFDRVPTEFGAVSGFVSDAVDRVSIEVTGAEEPLEFNPEIANGRFAVWIGDDTEHNDLLTGDVQVQLRSFGDDGSELGTLSFAEFARRYSDTSNCGDPDGCPSETDRAAAADRHGTEWEKDVLADGNVSDDEALATFEEIISCMADGGVEITVTTTSLRNGIEVGSTLDDSVLERRCEEPYVLVADAFNAQRSTGSDDPDEVDQFSSSRTDIALRSNIALRLPKTFGDAETEAGGLPLQVTVIDVGASFYDLVIGYGDCSGGNVCRVGSATATSASELAETGEEVQLANGIVGEFIPATCGANCSDAIIQWTEGPIRYTIGLKAGEQGELVELVNAALD